MWFSIRNIGLGMADFLGPGRITLGAHFTGVFGKGVGWMGAAGRPDVQY